MKKFKYLIGLLLVISSFSTIVITYANNYDYHLRKPVVLADYYKIKVYTDGVFDATDVNTLTVIISYIYDDTYFEEEMIPTNILLTPRIILLDFDGTLPPDGCSEVLITVDGFLTDGSTFVSSGGGPGFRRRP